MGKLKAISSNQLFLDLRTAPEYREGTWRKVRSWKILNVMVTWLQKQYTIHQEDRLGFFAPGYASSIAPVTVPGSPGERPSDADYPEDFDAALEAITDQNTTQNRNIPPKFLELL